MGRPWTDVKAWLDENDVAYKVRVIADSSGRALTYYELTRQVGIEIKKTVFITRLVAGARQPNDTIPDVQIVAAARELGIDARQVAGADIAPTIAAVNEVIEDGTWSSLDIEATFSQRTTEELDAREITTLSDSVDELTEQINQITGELE